MRRFYGYGRSERWLSPRRKLRPWVVDFLVGLTLFVLLLLALGEGNRRDNERIRQQIARWQATYAEAQPR